MKIEIDTKIPLSVLARSVINAIKDKIDLEKKKLTLDTNCYKYVSKVWETRLYDAYQTRTLKPLKWATQETTKATFVYAICKQKFYQWAKLLEQERIIEEKKEARYKKINENLTLPYNIL